MRTARRITAVILAALTEAGSAAAHHPRDDGGVPWGLASLLVLVITVAVVGAFSAFLESRRKSVKDSTDGDRTE